MKFIAGALNKIWLNEMPLEYTLGFFVKQFTFGGDEFNMSVCCMKTITLERRQTKH